MQNPQMNMQGAQGYGLQAAGAPRPQQLAPLMPQQYPQQQVQMAQMQPAAAQLGNAATSNMQPMQQQAMVPQQYQQMQALQQAQMRGMTPQAMQAMPMAAAGGAGMYMGQAYTQQQQQQAALYAAQLQQQQQAMLAAQQYPRNVVAPSPMHMQVHQQMNKEHAAAGVPGAWSTGLCGCMDDCYMCCQVTACLYAENYRKLHGSGFFCACLLMHCCHWFTCCFAATYRGALRAKYNLPAEPCGDCCVHCFCTPCAVCQEARELRIRNGWKTWHD
mmetsp:Transcript_5458/g.12087  ORF Transcript_5458/g.12087 Transcript_5458/m.12087 type:complete len:273 (+) Transcript_5458:167-985(+)